MESSEKTISYFEYDPIIYPRKLCVYIGKDLEQLLSAEFPSLALPEARYDAAAYLSSQRKSDHKYAILAIFPSKKSMTMGLMVHEASHVCDYIEKDLDIPHGGEPSAYLLGWIGDCLRQAYLGEGTEIKIKI